MSWEIHADDPRAAGTPNPRYRLVWGTRSAPVERLSEKGLSIKLDDSRGVPGLADLYQGERHIASVLLCSDAIEAGEHRFHFKRLTRHADGPPRDYAPDPDPVAFLPSPDRARQGL
ncbi:hypothetical protein SAMN04488020_105275 [Palleronia marisminoris]|uniref:Uncharacterized protein n=1 Tax=Palleronia marisminoris TaxID=315423 RepID=A0A1Y5SWY6_9RHOB|nr:hypothetical protein [Palleronia marisminoris]SFH00049.1 hypothetical protein SAMN04488020_105275 [Palleronia marisminoris]SLN48796.1 hypothetical protein PAM7066_02219 [Palleronia marisminoris]